MISTREGITRPFYGEFQSLKGIIGDFNISDLYRECQKQKLFQSLKGIIGDFNTADEFDGINKEFQSLKGIIGDFNAADTLVGGASNEFQSLKGIIGDFNFQNPNGKVVLVFRSFNP